MPLLQFGVTRSGAKLSRGRVVPVHLRALKTPLGLRWGTYDVYAMMEIFYWGEYAQASRWAIPARATVVDIGLATAYFSTLWPEARFLVVEPDGGNLAMLEANCAAIIGDGRAEVVTAFVADQDGEARIDRSLGSLGYRMGGDGDSDGDGGAGSETIRRIGIRSLLARAPDGPIHLLKCDVEGAEAEIFRSCADWIGRVEHLIVETHAPYDLPSLYADLRRNGFDFAVDRETPRSKPDGPSGICFLRRVASPGPGDPA